MKNFSLRQILAIALMVAAFAISASAQINIKDLKIGGKKPDPNKPPTTSPPSTNGNKTPTTNPIVNNTSGSGGGGATREQVNAFMADLRQFVQQRMKTGPKGSGKGIYLLKNMADQAARSDYSGCGAGESNMRLALDDGAAFAEIVKAKYATIENPTWTKDPESMTGDWRRAVENRSEIMKACITTRLAVEVQSKTAGLEEQLAKFKANPKDGGEWAGFILPLYFDDPASMHTRLAEKYKDSFAAVGATMPDASVFAPYDAAMKNLFDEAKSHAADWKWFWTGHDAMVEAKARGWLTQKDPKATIVKMGMLHTDWQIDSNNGSIPKGRYKRGYVMYRHAALQQCIVNSFSFEQDYMGNGRYNEMAVTSGMGNSVRLQNCN